MLPKKYRLPLTHRLVNSLTRKTSLCLVKSSPNSQENSRFGVIVSKKIDKRAVGRNRMRRLLQQWLQSHPELFDKNNDYLFVVTRSFETLTDSDEAELVRVLQ